MASLQGQMRHGVVFVSGKPHKRNGLGKTKKLGDAFLLYKK